MGAEVKTMDIKKAQQQASLEKAFDKTKVQDFVADVKGEIHQIHWTSRDELLTYAQIVAVATLVFGMGIYFMDLLIQGTLSFMSSMIHWVA